MQGEGAFLLQAPSADWLREAASDTFGAVRRAKCQQNRAVLPLKDRTGENRSIFPDSREYHIKNSRAMQQAKAVTII